MKPNEHRAYQARAHLRRDHRPADARERREVALHELIAVGCAHGLLVTLSSVRRAVYAGELRPLHGEPLRFDPHEANRWLSILKHAVIAAKEGL